MKLNKLFMMLTMLVLLGTTLFAQSTLYVDVTNGSDSYSGVNVTNSPAGTGPKATFAAARALVTNGGTIIIKAGTYAEVLDFSTGLLAATNSYTIQLSQLNSNNNIDFTAAGNVNLNKANLVVTITQSNGSEKINTTATTVDFLLGSVNLSVTGAWVLANNTTLNFTATSGLTNAAPTPGANVSLNYTGASSLTAGPESNYGTYGTGTIAVGKASGTTVTFPNAITAVAGINVTGGNATFSSAVAVTAGLSDVTNSGAGTLSFNSTLGLEVGAGNVDANLAQIENTSSGTISVSGATTWTGGAIGGDRDFGANYAILNSGSGSLTLAAINLVASDGGANRKFVVEARNGSTGTLTLGALTTAVTTTNTNSGRMRLTGAAFAGTINFAGGPLKGFITIGAGHTLNINGATSLTDESIGGGGALTNAGTITLNADLTLSAGVSVAHLTNGGTINGTAKLIAKPGAGFTQSFNGGTFAIVDVQANATSGVVNFQGSTFNANTINFTSGSAVGLNIAGNTTNMNVIGATVTVASTIVQTVTNFSQTGGSFTLAAGATTTLDVKGNFNRTTGTFAVGGAGNTLVSFTGSGAQAVNGGPLFQVEGLTFTNAGGIITVGNSIRATGTVTISTATNIDMSTLNLILNGGTNGIINNGTYTATGGGGVVLGGANTVTGGLAGAGYTMEGTGIYSYVTVDVGANTATVQNTTTGVKWNGVLTLRSGTLAVDNTPVIDFGPTGSNASIVRYPQDSPGITVLGLSTFNAGNIAYDLTYTGTLLANQAVGSEITVTPANVKTWTIQTTDGAGGPFLNTLPAGTNLNFGGTLYIEDGATLNLPTGLATAFVLSGNTKTHTIKGIISFADGTDVLSVTGTPVVINGSTTVAHAATIGSFSTSSTDLTIANVQSFAGTFTTLAGSVVKLGMGGSTLAAADQVITGAITLGGTSLTLNTDITSTAGVTQNAGDVSLGANNLLMNNNYNQAAGTISSTGGYLQFNTAATLTLVNSVPYLRANDVAITTGSALTISENLDLVDLTGGALGVIATAAAAHDVTIQKTMTTSGGAVFTGAGDLILAGAPTTVTASGNPTISNITVNTTGVATLATSDPTGPTARTFTVTGVLTQTAGDLAIGINSVSLTGAGNAYSRATATGQITQSSGQLIFAGTALQTPQQGTGFSIANMTINNTLAGTPDVTFLGGATNDFTVTGNLRLTAGDLSSTTAGKLHIGNLATITRNPALGSLVQVPTFDGDVNLSYVTGNGTMGNESPTAASGKLNNVTVNVPATLATLAATTLKGTLKITSGVFNNTGGAITIASGATLNYNGGTLGQIPTVTNYNLTYSASYGATTTTEFINTAGASVDQLTVTGAAVTVNLAQNRAVKNFTLAAGATFATGAFTLTTTGNVDVSAGTFTSAAGGALVFGGAAAQTFAIPASQTLAGNLTINNAAGVTLSGGNLTMGAGTVVTFTSGVLTTGAANWIQFDHSATGQGFVRTSGHVNGSVRHAIPAGAGSPTVSANGRFEFPVGTATRYRPYAITFSSTNPAINPTNITVGMIDSTPGGSMNLDAGNGLKIAGYPAYYWLVTANPSSFTSTQLFDVELTGTNIGIPYTSDQNLRIVRRQDGAAEYNPWALQNGSTYANYSVITGVAPNLDTTAVVRTTASIGGIVTQGTRFTIGVPARLPSFGASLTTFTVAEGATTGNTVQVTAVAQNAGETITGYTKVSGPAFAAVSATGLVTLTPGYSDGSATAYPVVVRVTTSGGLTADLTLNVTVTNVDRGPVFVASTTTVNPTTATVKNGVQLSITYSATDADADVVTYTVAADKAVSVAPVVSAAGVLTWTPAFADVALSPVTFTVTASSGTPAMTSTANTVVTVTAATEKGDVNIDGSVTAADAALILKYVVGLITLTPEQLYAADVNNDTQVGALDAAWVLYKSVNGGFPIAKSIAAAGNVEFGKFVNNKTAYSLPVNLVNTRGVLSVYTEVALGSSVDYKGVSTNLPEGWQVASNFENGVLKIAMAGLTPLTDGSIANINIALKSQDAVASVSGKVTMNDEVSTSMQAKVREIPSTFSLSQNYPNPFNPTTNIKYAISSDARVGLVIYNILGQAVRTLVNADQEAGFYTATWDGTNDFGSKVASGVYIYRITAGNFVSTIKMNLLK